MKLEQTIHDLTGLVSFSLPAVWRAHSAVWRTVHVSRLRHDPPPPPPPAGNLRIGKCFWTFWTKYFPYSYISVCHHIATRLRSLKSFPSQILLLSHMSGFFFHTYRKCSSHFLGSDPVVPGPDQAGVKPLSDQISVVFPKKNPPTSCFWCETSSNRRGTLRRRRSHATISCPQIYWFPRLSVTVSVSLPSSHHVLSLSLIITAASPRRLQWA